MLFVIHCLNTIHFTNHTDNKKIYMTLAETKKINNFSMGFLVIILLQC